MGTRKPRRSQIPENSKTIETDQRTSKAIPKAQKKGKSCLPAVKDFTLRNDGVVNRRRRRISEGNGAAAEKEIVKEMEIH